MKPFLVQGAPFSVSVVPRSVGCHAGELLLEKPHGEGSPAHAICAPPLPWISIALISPIPFVIFISLCLLSFTEGEEMGWGEVPPKECCEAPIAGRVQGAPKPREGCTHPLTLRHCSSAPEGELDK